MDRRHRRFTGHHEPWWLAIYVVAINVGLAGLRFAWVWLSFRLTLLRRPESRARPNWRIIGAMSFAGVRGASHHTERSGALVFSGVIGIAVGVIFFLWPLVATAAYAFMLVVFVALRSLITGVLELSAAIRLRRHVEGEVLLAIVGALSILLGIAVLWLLMTAPGATLISVGWLIGVYALASGAALVVLALRLKRHRLVAAA